MPVATGPRVPAILLALVTRGHPQLLPKALAVPQRVLGGIVRSVLPGHFDLAVIHRSGEDVHYAAHRIPAIKRREGPARDLHAIHLRDWQGGPEDATCVCVVHRLPIEQNQDACLVRASTVEATHSDAGQRILGPLCAERIEALHQAQALIEGPGIPHVQFTARQNAGRHRRFLQFRLRPGASDHDGGLDVERVRGVLLRAIVGRLSLCEQTGRDNQNENNSGRKHNRNPDSTTFRATNERFVCCWYVRSNSGSALITLARAVWMSGTWVCGLPK